VTRGAVPPTSPKTGRSRSVPACLCCVLARLCGPFGRVLPLISGGYGPGPARNNDNDKKKRT
jgi:hypothetical protein